MKVVFKDKFPSKETGKTKLKKGVERFINPNPFDKDYRGHNNHKHNENFFDKDKEERRSMIYQRMLGSGDGRGKRKMFFL